MPFLRSTSLATKSEFFRGISDFLSKVKSIFIDLDLEVEDVECLLGEVLFFFFTVNRNQMRDAWEDLSDFTEEIIDTVLRILGLPSGSSPNYYRDLRFRSLDHATSF